MNQKDVISETINTIRTQYWYFKLTPLDQASLEDLAIDAIRKISKGLSV